MTIFSITIPMYFWLITDLAKVSNYLNYKHYCIKRFIGTTKTCVIHTLRVEVDRQLSMTAMEQVTKFHKLTIWDRRVEYMYVSQGTSDAITRVDFVKAKSKLGREMSYLLVLIWIAPQCLIKSRNPSIVKPFSMIKMRLLAWVLPPPPRRGRG